MLKSISFPSSVVLWRFGARGRSPCLSIQPRPTMTPPMALSTAMFRHAKREGRFYTFESYGHTLASRHANASFVPPELDAGDRRRQRPTGAILRMVHNDCVESDDMGLRQQRPPFSSKFDALLLRVSKPSLRLVRLSAKRTSKAGRHDPGRRPLTS